MDASTDSTRDAFVDVPGGRVFVRAWERASRESPLILLHDSLGCVDLWREFPGALSRRLRRTVFAYDRLGFGRSSERHDVPSADFVREEATTQFPALRRALGIDRCVLFGHSVGGSMAFHIASTWPDACDAVISEATQPVMEERTFEGIRDACRVFARPEQFEKLRRLHGSRAEWVLRAWAERWLSPEFARWSLEAVLAAVRCPILAIHGDRDEFGSIAFPRAIERWSSGPCTVAILEPCGHVPHRERANDVLTLVARFLEGTSAAAPAVE
ncbi:MAG: alpha/beta hydrolase [Phycisphaerales bacterium]